MRIAQKWRTLISDDLKQLGIRRKLFRWKFRSLLDRVTQTKEYDACVLGLVSFDADPSADINVWLSSVERIFGIPRKRSGNPWEAEIDKLIQQQRQQFGSYFAPKTFLYEYRGAEAGRTRCRCKR